jgi:Tfp pilus assembly protein PilN
MRKAACNTALCFPGEKEREFWICDQHGVWKEESRTFGGVMGVETILFDSSPFWSAGADESQDESVALRWEALGLSGDGDARKWTHWPVIRQDQRLLLGTLAFAPDASDIEGDAFHAGAFEPSARLLPLPASGLAVWCELGRHVVAFTRGTVLLHVTTLASRELDADAALEIRDVFAALQAHGFLEDLESIHVWTSCGTEFVPQLACLFGNAAVLKEARPHPRPPSVGSNLLPASVARRKRDSRQKQRQMLVLAALTLVCLGFFGCWWLRLQWRDSRVNRAEQELAAVQPEIERVREAQSRWLDLETAVNPDLYPVELFHQIVALLPEQGVRLQEFQVDDGRLIVKGEATTVNHALGFRDRLASCAALSRYAWTLPVPIIREDNRAEFSAEGTSNGEVPHEGQ